MHHAQSDQNEVSIGDRIRVLRLERNLSQRKLAAASGISANALSLIERGKTSPTASTMQKLAVALGVKISDFFESPGEGIDDIVLVRAGERCQAEMAQGLVENLGRGGAKTGDMVPLIITLDPGARSGAPLSYSGQLFIYCLSGSLLNVIDGQSITLGAGDSLLFDAARPHHWHNVAEQPSRALFVLYHVEEGADVILGSFGAASPDPD